MRSPRTTNDAVGTAAQVGRVEMQVAIAGHAAGRGRAAGSRDWPKTSSGGSEPARQQLSADRRGRRGSASSSRPRWIRPRLERSASSGAIKQRESDRAARAGPCPRVAVDVVGDAVLADEVPGPLPSGASARSGPSIVECLSERLPVRAHAARRRLDISSYDPAGERDSQLPTGGDDRRIGLGHEGVASASQSSGVGTSDRSTRARLEASLSIHGQHGHNSSHKPESRLSGPADRQLHRRRCRRRSSVKGNSGCVVPAAARPRPGRVAEREEARTSAALGLVGVDRERLVSAAAGMGHVIGAAAERPVRSRCRRCRTPAARAPGWSGAGTTAAARRDSARRPRTRRWSPVGCSGTRRPLHVDHVAVVGHARHLHLQPLDRRIDVARRAAAGWLLRPARATARWPAAARAARRRW